MAELTPAVIPQITYSPEGILRIQDGLDKDCQFPDIPDSPGFRQDRLAQRLAILEELGSSKDNTVAITPDAFQLELDVKAAVHNHFKGFENEKSAAFLRKISTLLPFEPDDGVDRVISIDTLSSKWCSAKVNQHFQRWMNVAGLDEPTALATITALAEPFAYDPKIKRRALRGFQYGQAPGQDNAQSFEVSMHVALNSDQFGLTREDTTPESVSYTRGEVSWRWLDMATLGSCACLGATGEERQRVRFSPDTKALYDMDSHNIDASVQSFSLLLGLGALAYAASQPREYESTEDIFAAATWGEPRVYQR